MEGGEVNALEAESPGVDRVGLGANTADRGAEAGLVEAGAIDDAALAPAPAAAGGSGCHDCERCEETGRAGEALECTVRAATADRPAKRGEIDEGCSAGTAEGLAMAAAVLRPGAAALPVTALPRE